MFVLRRREEIPLSRSVEFTGVAKAELPRSLPYGKEVAASPGATLISACEAAKRAMLAFDDAARKGEDFTTLCELSKGERRAVNAVCRTRSSTALGVVEKALLLDRFLTSARRTEVTQETVDVALSLANDALSLAKALSGAAAQRLGKKRGIAADAGGSPIRSRDSETAASVM